MEKIIGEICKVRGRGTYGVDGEGDDDFFYLKKNENIHENRQGWVGDFGLNVFMFCDQGSTW